VVTDVGTGRADLSVIWLNGAFGAGKTSVAAELASRRPMISFDPEVIGVLGANRASIEQRLTGRPDTTDWTWQQVDRCLTALEDRRFQAVVSTDGRTVAEIADEIENDLSGGVEARSA
jgi:hypothetical protein